MADPRGFLKNTERELPERRPVPIRLKDWKEVYEERDKETLTRQAGRCMDCGIPFCHSGCPLGNLIPEWNNLTWRDDMRDAIVRLHATNNFPEFTGRLCPAPCETACVLGINQPAVTIKQVEVSIIDHAWDRNLVQPEAPDRLSGRTVAVVGSGPAGLAAAQQLTRAGHTVAVYERSDQIGGLLRFGIPEFKMEKSHIDRRLTQMEAEGTRFRPGITIGGDGPNDISGSDLRRRYDAVVVATGSTIPRALPVDGADLNGIVQAMDYLPQANRVAREETVENQVLATDKNVVIIGGGDTGADCLGTALRQGAKNVVQLEIMPRPTEERPTGQPWPTYPMIYRVSSAHEEGGTREYAVSTQRFNDDGSGNVTSLDLVEVTFVDGKFEPVPGTEKTLKADLVLLAMGFIGPERTGLVEELDLELDGRGNIVRDESYHTNKDGVFAAGDAGRGQSLIVWAIAEGRACAAAVDTYLMGSTQLPAPIPPSERPLTV